MSFIIILLASFLIINLLFSSEKKRIKKSFSEELQKVNNEKAKLEQQLGFRKIRMIDSKSLLEDLLDETGKIKPHNIQIPIEWTIKDVLERLTVKGE